MQTSRLALFAVLAMLCCGKGIAQISIFERDTVRFVRVRTDSGQSFGCHQFYADDDWEHNSAKYKQLDCSVIEDMRRIKLSGDNVLWIDDPLRLHLVETYRKGVNGAPLVDTSYLKAQEPLPLFSVVKRGEMIYYRRGVQ